MVTIRAGRVVRVEGGWDVVAVDHQPWQLTINQLTINPQRRARLSTDCPQRALLVWVAQSSQICNCEVSPSNTSLV